MGRPSAVRNCASLHGGEIFAVPVPGMRCCPLIIARAPAADAQVGFAFAYLDPKLLKSPPTPDDIAPLESWNTAWLGLISTTPLRNGRWKRCGSLPKFDRGQWPIPPARNSAVDEAVPAEQWASHPWGEMWSIETTADEPSLTLLSNTPATRAEALQFPQVSIVTGANRLEKALATHFKGRTPGFWDMRLDFSQVTADSPRRWREYADTIRSQTPPRPTSWLPAGRSTDRQLKHGAWMGLPLAGGGFGAALHLGRPERHVRFFSDGWVMAMRRRWDRWPTLSELTELSPGDGALVAQTSMIAVRDGRWRVIGYHDKFADQSWIWPRPWHRVPGASNTGEIEIPTQTGTRRAIVSPAILNLDPTAGDVAAVYSTYRSIELAVPRILDGTLPFPTHGPNWKGVVTPARLEARRKMNAALEQTVASDRSKR